MRCARLLPALLVAAFSTLVVGCDGGAPGEPGRPVVVTSVDTLRPGQVARVRGSGLAGLRALRLDGVAATELVVRSDSLAEFRVPTLRACETDLRAVAVAVAVTVAVAVAASASASASADGSAPVGAVVRVPPSVALRPGESRVLAEADLRCLRLAAADEDYVLSAANLAVPTAPAETPRALVAVRVLGTGDAAAPAAAAPAAAGPLASFSARDAGAPVERPTSRLAASTGAHSRAPVPFDPRYATAVEGDTLRFVDWLFGAGQVGICHQPAESVPSYRAQVVAVSGKVAIVVDLRHPLAGAFLDPAKNGWLREAAAMTDRLLLPTMRSVFDADYEPPAGGGGRFYLLLTTLPPFAGGAALDGVLPASSLGSQAICPRASEMVVSRISAELHAQPQFQSASWAVGGFLHEYAHNVDLLTNPQGRTAGIIGEGLATLAEETASRIGSGQPLGARHSRVDSDAPAISRSVIGMWGTEPERGPWQSNGFYGPSGRMLMFMRELAGEASVEHGRRPTLYQRLIAAPIDWASGPAVTAHLTAVLGIDYADLTDRQALASVTAGLIDPGVAHDLPRYTAWDHSERARQSGPRSAGFAGRASRRVGGERTLAAANGGHAALYLMGDGPRGVSLELTSMAPTARIVRLTRLR